MTDVAVICGSTSDSKIALKTKEILDTHHVSYDFAVLSAHRDPEKLDEYIRDSDCKIFIAIAGLSAALPGVIAARTTRPVIGVPVSGTLNGLDALLSISQMPRGVPVACVGIDNGENAAYLALRILGISSPSEHS